MRRFGCELVPDARREKALDGLSTAIEVATTAGFHLSRRLALSRDNWWVAGCG